MNFILFIAIVAYLFFVSKSYYERCSPVQKLFIVLLFMVHFAAMGIAYHDTITYTENDAFYFYKKALKADSWLPLFGLGSSFLNFLIYPLVQAGVTLFVLLLFFATISYQAFLWYFDQMAKHQKNAMNTTVALLIQGLFLLPSLHYWSGLLGKDVLVFFLLSYLVFEFKKETRIKGLHIFVSIVLLVLRPHIFGATLIAFIIYCLTQKNISKSIKIKLLILSLSITGALVPILMRFVNVDTLTYDSISAKFMELNLYAASKGGSGISLVEVSYPERIWLLLFRPLFYDVKTSYQYIISFENSIVLIIMTLSFFYLFSKKESFMIAKEVKFALLTGSCILLMIAVYIYNLGLASRMRLMFLPLFFYVLHHIVTLKYAKKL
jgi:hypothetical protein